MTYYEQWKTVYAKNAYLKMLLILSLAVSAIFLGIIIFLTFKNSHENERIHKFIQTRYTFTPATVKVNLEKSYDFMSNELREKLQSPDKASLIFITGKNISQSTYPYKVTVDKNKIEVLCDRIITISGIKIARSLKLDLTLIFNEITELRETNEELRR